MHNVPFFHEARYGHVSSDLGILGKGAMYILFFSSSCHPVYKYPGWVFRNNFRPWVDFLGKNYSYEVTYKIQGAWVFDTVECLTMSGLASSRVLEPGIKTHEFSPGWAVLFIRASSQYAKVVGSISGQGTYKKQPMNAKISGTTNLSLSVSLSVSVSLSLSLLFPSQKFNKKCMSLNHFLNTF